MRCFLYPFYVYIYIYMVYVCVYIYILIMTMIIIVIFIILSIVIIMIICIERPVFREIGLPVIHPPLQSTTIRIHGYGSRELCSCKGFGLLELT